VRLVPAPWDVAVAPYDRSQRDVKHQPAAEILDAIKADLVAFSEPSDDISILVIKRE